MKQKDYLFIGGVSLVIFLVTYTFLTILGFVPEQFKFNGNDSDVIVVDGSNNIIGDSKSEYDAGFDDENISDNTNLIPTTIQIPKIGVSSVIQAPSSVDVASLDNALTKGAVYYPGSGTLQDGNMFIFGHSTNWKVVNNQAYKTFNDLDKLKLGDEIKLTSGDSTYVYSVTSVTRASEDDALVDFSSTGRKLTISTCDTFGRKQDRWVVEAVFVRVS